ncbi:MAG: class I SAM-dependent methyltransferase [Proteobacteria bacterium]|nr:class I SAM-dependent methyltransferase [Pseudomonadota bacterium]
MACLFLHGDCDPPHSFNQTRSSISSLNCTSVPAFLEFSRGYTYHTKRFGTDALARQTLIHDVILLCSTTVINMSNRNNDAENKNILLWNELAPVHSKSYNIDKLKRGGHLLDEIQMSEVGDVTGKSMLHLQCHIGTDSLSWARLGASVTGVDFSERSIEIADKLKSDLSLDAHFINCNVYDLPKHVDKTFDIVYTSQGVLCWLSDLHSWAKLIFKYLKPNGFFYLMESHPFLYVLDDSGSRELNVKNSYFHNNEPDKWLDDSPDYSDENYVTSTPSYEWQWTISDIVNSLISAGLQIEFVNEYDKIFYKAHPDMKQANDEWWYLPKTKPGIPLIFTMKARR